MAEEPTELREREMSEEGEQNRRRGQTVSEQLLNRKPMVLEEPRRKVNRKLRNLLE